MSDRAIAILILGAVIVAAAVLIRNCGSPSTAISTARRERRGLHAPSKYVLLSILILYAGTHAIQLRWVAQKRGIPNAIVYLLSAALPWVVTLIMCFGTARAERSISLLDRGRSAHRWILALVMSAVSLAILLTLWRSSGYPTNIDDSLYLFQSQLFKQGHLVWAIPDWWQPWVAIKQVIVARDRVYSQYPPGWPGLLAMWSLFAPPWLLGPMLLGLLVASTYQIGRSLFGSTVGLLAAGLAASSGPLLYWGGTLFSDVPTAALIAASAAGLTLGAKGDSRRAYVWSAISGALMGLVFATRPLSAISASPLILFVAARSLSPDPGGDWSRLRMSLLILVLASIPSLAGVLAYNFATTGNALTFGYTQANGSLHSLGFGLRGFIEIDSDGRQHVNATLFTLRDALVATGRRLANFDQSLFGGFMVPVVAATALRRSIPRGTWMLLAAASALPLAHLFWFYTDVRYYLPLVPFLAIATAACLSATVDFGARTGWRLATILLLCNSVLPLAALPLDGDLRSPFRRDHDTLEIRAALQEHERVNGPTVLFVFEPGSYSLFLWRLYDLNTAREGQTPTLVLRDRGDVNADIMRFLPGWSVLCLDATMPDSAKLVTPPTTPTCRPR